MKKSLHTFVLLLPLLLLLAGCETTNQKNERDGREAANRARSAMAADIRSEPPGDYFIGRRYYKKDYKFWGYIRQPGQPWSTAKLVMMNEQTKLAPDRELNQIGSDNNYEYKLTGHFSGEAPVYEPASNGFYPEFILTGYQLKSVSPAPIFHTAAATDPERRVIGTPY